MAEHNLTYDQQQEVESHAPYLKVFVALLVLTIVEYLYARLFTESFAVLVAGLVCLAAVKAGMVGWYFMHLKFEGRWVYVTLLPAAFLATVLVVLLIPDIGWEHEGPAPAPEMGTSPAVRTSALSPTGTLPTEG